MARFGRGQPHAPLYLRAPILAAAVVASLAPQFHIVLADAHRPPPAHVIYLRPSRTSLVPDRLGSPIHILLQRHRVPLTQVVFFRNQGPIVPDRLAPQFHIVQADPRASRHPARDADVTTLRNRQVPVAETPRLAPQLHIIQSDPRMARHPARDADVTLLWNTRLTTVIPDRLPPQIHVASLAFKRYPVIRPLAVQYIRPSRASLVPNRITKQLQIIGAASLRKQAPAVNVGITSLRNPAGLVAPIPARQVHVISLAPNRSPVVGRRSSVEWQRTPSAIVLPPQLKHAIARSHGTAAVRTSSQAVTPIRTASSGITGIRRHAGDSIMDSYVTSNEVIRTSDAAPSTSKGPMGG